MSSLKTLSYFVTFFLFFSSPLLAAETSLDDITNSATIGSITETITSPLLISPSDNSLTNNRYQNFVWQPATSTSGIHHYTLYLDDLIIVPYITNALYQNTSIYTANFTNNRFYLQLKSPLSEGSHTAKVLAYTNQNNSSSSSTHTFTVDATIPLIILQAVDKHIVYWASHDPYSIPPTNQRHFDVTTSQPLLTGKTEAGANLKLSLACPANTPSCQDQSYTGTVSDGNWKHRFYHLESGLTYTAYLSATDPAGNSNIFPAFTVTYTPTSIFTLPIFPTTTPTPKTTLTPTPTPRPAEELAPLIEPPPAPTLPPAPTTTPTTTVFPPDWFLPLAFLLLLAHLAFTAFASAIPLTLIPRFLGLLLLPPFLFPRDDLTLTIDSQNSTHLLPFTIIDIFSLDQIQNNFNQLATLIPQQRLHHLQPVLTRPQHRLISDFQGSFNLQLSPGHYLLTAHHPGYTYPDQLIPPSPTNNQTTTFIYHAETITIDPQQRLTSPQFHLRSSQGHWYLPLNPQTSLTPLESLQKLLMSIRSLPLFLSLPFSLLLLYFSPSYTIISLTLSSSLLIFNQHLYPLISKPKTPQF